jgi:hypothetical protein
VPDRDAAGGESRSPARMKGALGEPNRDGSRRARAWFAGLGQIASVALYLGLLLAWFWTSPVNHDSSWFLHATREWLAGARLYEDIFEINPPLVFYLHAPAVLIADTFRITTTQAFYVSILVLIGVSLCWSTGIVRRGGFPLSRSWLFLIGSALAMVLPFTSAFGQREQFLTIFLWPYVTAHLSLAKPDNGTGSVNRAIFAAVGVLLKPYFVLIPAMVILGRIVAERRWQAAFSRSSIVLAVAGLTYLVTARLLYPVYFDRTVPDAMEVYGAYRHDTVHNIMALKPWLIALSAVVIGAAATAGWPRRLGYVCLAAAGALGVYLIQWNGFGYHALPLFAFLLLAHTWIAVQAGSRRVTALAVMGYLLLAQFVFVLQPYGYAGKEVFAPYLSGPDRARSMVVVSADLPPYFPLVDYFGTRWEGRFPVQWMVPGAVIGLAANSCSREPGRCARLQGLIDRARSLTAEDVSGKRPDLVVFSGWSPFFRPLGADGYFDMEALFFADSGFATAMADYRRVGAAANHTFWRRKDQLP